MARLALVVKTVTRAGIDLGSGQAVLLADGAEVVNDGLTAFLLENTTGAPIIVTFVTPQTILQSPGLAVADQTFSVPANVKRHIGAFPPDSYNLATGLMEINVAANGVTITPYKITTGA